MRASRRVQENLTDLEYLVKAKAAVQKRLIGRAPKELILAIVDVAKALIKGELNLNGRQFAAAKAQKRDIQRLAGRGRIDDKRALLEQRGNLIGAVLGPLTGSLAKPVLGALGSLFGGGGGLFGGDDRRR